MTTLTDMQLLGEFGWTAQAIYDHSGGIVPRYWRPPYVSPCSRTCLPVLGLAGPRDLSPNLPIL